MTSSIIIPIYNAQDTLSYCLDSILNQTTKDFELILINDGSTDNSQDIIDTYVNNHPNVITSYTQVNSGIAKARNKGIELSKGEYIFFIDNDDYIDNNYIETFINSIEQNQSDVVLGGYRRIGENGKVLYSRHASNNPWTKYMIVAPWARVYRKKSLIKNKLYFLDNNIGEDIWLNIVANLKLNVKTLDYTGYNWISRKTSLSNTLHRGLNEKVDFLLLLEKIYNETKEIKIEDNEKDYLEYFFLKTCIYYILKSGKGVELTLLKNENQEIFNLLKEMYPSYQENKFIRISKPKGEYPINRIIVFIYILLQRLKLENTFFWIYSKL